MTKEQDMTLEALLARIDQLESRHALRDLVSDYCHGFDKHDLPRFMNIWWEDCVWDIGAPFGSFAGHEGVRSAVTDILWPFWRETHHLTTNLTLRFDDADHARGECNVDCLGASMDDQPLMVGASYLDKFERRNGIWRIKQRDVTLHFFNPIPGAQLSAPSAAE